MNNPFFAPTRRQINDFVRVIYRSLNKLLNVYMMPMHLIKHFRDLENLIMKEHIRIIKLVENKFRIKIKFI